MGGGPAGSCAAEILAQNPSIECIMFERKFDNAKPCGGAIPVCMVEEFNLPSEIIDRKVTYSKLTATGTCKIVIYYLSISPNDDAISH